MSSSPHSQIRWKFRVYLSYVAAFLEIFLALLLAIALAISIIQLIPSIFQIKVSIEEIDVFHQYLEALFVLVIGVEALKLLCKHTPGSALEILLFTIAREMIVSHTTPEQNLLVVLSIAIIFAIRKFLYVPAWGAEEQTSSFDEARRHFDDFLRRHEHKSQKYTRCSGEQKTDSAVSDITETAACEDAEVSVVE